MHTFCLCIYCSHCTSKPTFDRPKFTMTSNINTTNKRKRVIGPKTTVFFYFCLFNRTPKVCGKYVKCVAYWRFPPDHWMRIQMQFIDTAVRQTCGIRANKLQFQVFSYWLLSFECLLKTCWWHFNANFLRIHADKCEQFQSDANLRFQPFENHFVIENLQLTKLFGRKRKNAQFSIACNQ